MEEGPADDFAYDLAPESAPTRPVIVVTPLPAETKTPITIPYRRAGVVTTVGPGDPEQIRDFLMPVWLLGGGIVIEIVAAFFRERTFASALIYVGVEVIFGTAVMLVGVMLAARWRQIKLGSLQIAAFKLAAISVAPAAALDLVTPLARIIPFGGLIAWAGSFLLYFALIGAFFDLDESDTWYCVCVIFLVRLAVYFAFVYGLSRWV